MPSINVRLSASLRSSGKLKKGWLPSWPARKEYIEILPQTPKFWFFEELPHIIVCNDCLSNAVIMNRFDPEFHRDDWQEISENKPVVCDLCRRSSGDKPLANQPN